MTRTRPPRDDEPGAFRLTQDEWRKLFALVVGGAASIIGTLAIAGWTIASSQIAIVERITRVETLVEGVNVRIGDLSARVSENAQHIREQRSGGRP